MESQLRLNNCIFLRVLPETPVAPFPSFTLRSIYVSRQSPRPRPPSLSLSSVCGGFRKSHDDDFPSNLRPVVPNPLCPLPSCIPCRQAKVLALLGNIAFLCCELVTGKCIKSITYSKICNVKRIGNFCSLDWLIQLGRTLKDDFLPLSMISLPTR